MTFSHNFNSIIFGPFYNLNNKHSAKELNKNYNRVMKKLLILTFAVLAFAACAKESSQQQPVQTDNTVAQAPAAYTLPAVFGGEDFVLEKENPSKPILVASMAGFCSYCKKMLPLIDEMAGKYKDKNVDIVIAFVDPANDKLKEIDVVKNAKNAKIHYNAAHFGQDMGVTGFPTMFFIGTNGETKKWIGADPAYIELMSATIDESLK